MQQFFCGVEELRSLQESVKKSFFYVKELNKHQITWEGSQYDRVHPQTPLGTFPFRKELHLIVRSESYWLLTKGSCRQDSLVADVPIIRPRASKLCTWFSSSFL